MFKGTVNFRGPFQGIAFESIEITPPIADAGVAILQSTQADGMTLRVTINKADTEEAALQTARTVASYVAKVISYHFDQHIKTFGQDDHALVEEKDAGLPVHHVGQSIGFFMKVEDECHNIGEQKTADLKKTLEQAAHRGFLFYDQFRAALSLGDPLARFMSLYNIVLSLCNDSQEDVDAFVLSVDPATPTNAPFRPRRSGTPETVYTRLRNQVGHVRTGTTIDGTRAEMQANLSGLVKMAKTLIDRQP